MKNKKAKYRRNIVSKRDVTTVNKYDDGACLKSSYLNVV